MPEEKCLKSLKLKSIWFEDGKDYGENFSKYCGIYVGTDESNNLFTSRLDYSLGVSGVIVKVEDPCRALSVRREVLKDMAVNSLNEARLSLEVSWKGLANLLRTLGPNQCYDLETRKVGTMMADRGLNGNTENFVLDGLCYNEKRNALEGPFLYTRSDGFFSRGIISYLMVGGVPTGLTGVPWLRDFELAYDALRTLRDKWGCVDGNDMKARLMYHGPTDTDAFLGYVPNFWDHLKGLV